MQLADWLWLHTSSVATVQIQNSFECSKGCSRDSSISVGLSLRATRFAASKAIPTKLEIASSALSGFLAMTERYFHGAVIRTLLSSAAWPRYDNPQAAEIVFSRE